ncbi:MAG: acyl carrier protein [Pseudomonadota bacterium]
MSTVDQYKAAFINTFRVPSEEVEALAYQSIEQWDSLGHMQLMSELEDIFKVELDIDDIIDFSSFAKGQEILGKYGVALNG